MKRTSGLQPSEDLLLTDIMIRDDMDSIAYVHWSAKRGLGNARPTETTDRDWMLMRDVEVAAMREALRYAASKGIRALVA